MNSRVLALVVCVALFLPLSPLSAGDLQVVDVQNPVFIPNTLFTGFEDLSSPRFDGLRDRYGLEEAVDGATDEFRRILLLRHWLHEHVNVVKTEPAVEGDPLDMLAAAPDGGAYSCGHMMAMQQTVLSAMGHVTRSLFCGSGMKERRMSGSHGMNEVWVNDLQKWVAVDAEHDAHFEKEGVPLSAMEIRAEVWKNGGKDVYRADGPDRERQPPERDDSWGRTPRTYAFISWYPEMDLHTRYPEKRSAKEIVIDDEIWRNNTWYRSGGVKHFAYEKDLFIPVSDPTAIYWTPNVLKVDAVVDGDSARVSVTSETPNLEEYQIRTPGGEWSATPAAFTLDVGGGGEWQLRSVNTAGVSGPVYRLVFAE